MAAAPQPNVQICTESGSSNCAAAVDIERQVILAEAQCVRGLVRLVTAGQERTCDARLVVRLPSGGEIDDAHKTLLLIDSVTSPSPRRLL
ncbi:hypothetical protein [Streptomyces capitiformicae]|uniref:hypothetical protein n=1 Tax=Streptomyces capitiformicae TaxID=2014920 RepID=UPI0016752D72|nr:hypothetical protein [Streptomyces capitiformicae]